MRYSQNPNLELKTVTTVNGKTEYRKDCRKIKDKFYVKDEDVFFIDGTWYRLEGGKIVFDHETKRMVVKDNTRLTEGIIGFDGNSPKFGAFSLNPYTNCTLEGTPCIDYKLIPGNPIFTKGTYFIRPKMTQPIENSNDYRRHSYNIEDNPERFEDMKRLYNNFNPKIDKDLLALSKYLGNVTYGIEIEAIRGSMPQHFLNQGGVIICRDGSLVNPDDGSTGPEYVTVPLQGAKGLQSLRNFATEAAKTNMVDINCALHVHLGSLRNDRTFLVAMYKLGVQIQNEVFRMFPKYKENEMKYAGKQKNYCKKLTNFIGDYSGGSKEDYDKYINDSYKTLFSFMLNGQAVPNFSINRTSRQHPEREKWRRVARYHWINFMNMFFSDRNTIEFRLHTPTTNHTKIINWVMIVNAICRFADQNTLNILKGTKFTFMDVLAVYGDKDISAYLIDYYKSRVAEFKADTAGGDIIAIREIADDKKYTFKSFK